jgi:lysophospholipase L1-like esterase
MTTRNRLTVLGDSFVEGRGDPVPGGGMRGWVPMFASLLGIPRGAYRNLGANLATTRTVLDTQVARALVNKPPLIGVVAGFNDLMSDFDAGRFGATLRAIYDHLTGCDTLVFTSTFPDIAGNLPVPEPFRRLLRERFDAANDVVRDLATDTGVLCVDITRSPRWREPGMWCPDRVHPGPDGHRLYAEIMAHAVGIAAADGMTGVAAAGLEMMERP